MKKYNIGDVITFQWLEWETEEERETNGKIISIDDREGKETDLGDIGYMVVTKEGLIACNGRDIIEEV